VNAAIDIYAGVDPRDVPIYRVNEAARYLSLPERTLRSWVFGQPDHFQRVIVAADEDARLLSFTNLVEAHVLSSLRGKHQIPLPRVRRAIKYLMQSTGAKRPLAEIPLMTDGAEIFVDAYRGRAISASSEGQYSLMEVVSAYLQRIERDPAAGLTRLYPMTRKRELPSASVSEQPKVVVIDPRISFGRPILARSNIRTSLIAERWQAGESVEDLAQDYGRPSFEIQEAIRCETPIDPIAA